MSASATKAIAIRVWQTCERFGSSNYPDGKWSTAMLRRAGLFLGDGVDDVGFDTINPGGSKPVEDLALESGHQYGMKLFALM
jgi:hypothetical protein